MAKLLCFYLCLFDKFIVLHAMDEKYQWLVTKHWKWILYVIKDDLLCDV